jgi:hypothetical protein
VVTPGYEKLQNYQNAYSIRYQVIAKPLDSFLAEFQGSIQTIRMDIEGFEWQALWDLSPEALARFRIMSIEFHGSQNLYNEKLFTNLYEPVINKILLSFDVVHVHPNNCCGLHKFGSLEFPNIFEVTFHRKDRATGISGFTELPNRLDVKNVPANPDIFITWSSLE